MFKQEQPRSADPVQERQEVTLGWLGNWLTESEATKQEAVEGVRGILRHADAIAKHLSPDQELLFWLRIRQNETLARIRSVDQLAKHVLELGINEATEHVNALRRLRNELERRVRLLEVAASQGQKEISPPDANWFLERGTESDLADLGRIRQVAKSAGQESCQLLQDAERTIIWRVSADPDQWLEALQFAGPEERMWLVTALISRVILKQGDQVRQATGGTTETPAKTLIPAQQQDALVELLSSQDENVRAEVIYALGEAGGGEAVPKLASIVRGHDPIRLRRHATVALGRIGGPVAVQELIEFATPDEDERVGFYAVNGLRNLLPTADGESAQAVRKFLKALFETDGTPAIMREAARQALRASTDRESEYIS